MRFERRDCRASARQIGAQPEIARVGGGELDLASAAYVVVGCMLCVETGGIAVALVVLKGVVLAGDAGVGVGVRGVVLAGDVVKVGDAMAGVVVEGTVEVVDAVLLCVQQRQVRV
jgi:hypothetical protein